MSRDQDRQRHIILDLDQTIISGEPIDEFEVKNEERKENFTFHTMDRDYYIFERPNLQPFLDYIFANFKVSVWTAASKDYALFIIENIILQKKDRKLEWIFYAYHCEISEKLTKSPKNLTVLSNNFDIDDFKGEVFIFDDNEEVYNPQPDRCLIAKPFFFTDEGSENDDYLTQVTLLLEKGKSVKKMNKKLLKDNSN
jgi:TFIIF-interacting CTD phosphatase-like protein